jgi:hypothetical protein
MAITDILSQTGDIQAFILEIPNGNGAYLPEDILINNSDPIMCTEIPETVGGGGGNIFIMSE